MMTWLLNQRCNFRCCYCANPSDILSTEHPGCAKHDTDFIVNRFNETGKTWKILLTGGEPFLYPQFVPLCAGLTKKHSIGILTNLSTNTIAEFARTIDPDKVHAVGASLHILEREKHPGALLRFIDSVLLLQKRGFNVSVEYVTYPALFDRLDNDIGMLTSSGVALVNLKVFRGYYQTRAYPSAFTPEQRRIIRERALDEDEVKFIDRKFNFWGHTCSAGTDFFVMDPGGTVRRCSTAVVSMGNFFDGTFEPNRTPHACPFPRCGCAYEGMYRTSASYTKLTAILSEAAAHVPQYLLQRYHPQKILWYLQRRLIGRK
jgi:MoaA/NifB/PqqE/SkfB family radical SAM enzyme